jgi:hypothetical protein
MAKKPTSSAVITKLDKPKRKRPGVHSKKKNSVHKSGKHYNKAYKGQGKRR